MSMIGPLAGYLGDQLGEMESGERGLFIIVEFCSSPSWQDVKGEAEDGSQERHVVVIIAAG